MNNKTTLSPEVKELLRKYKGEIQKNQYKNLILEASKEGEEVLFEIRDVFINTEETLPKDKRTMCNGFDAQIAKLLCSYAIIENLVKII